MFLESIATALPEYHYTQPECLEAMKRSSVAGDLRPGSLILLDRLLSNGKSGIQQRYFCLDNLEPVFDRSAQELNEIFEVQAPQLAANALVPALAEAGIEANELDALFVCTCTGYLCPGVSSYLAESLGMVAGIYLQDLVGLGCGAAIPTMRAAQGFLAANPGAKVATVAVEVCSAAFYADNDPGVLVSLCLFGDGAAAAIWTDEAAPGKWKADAFTTVHRPEDREEIRFVNSGGKLKNQLAKTVPGLAALAVKELYDDRQAEPDRVLSHAGGRDVIEEIEKQLPHTLTETRDVFSLCGNMSSPSVLFALEKAFREPGGDRHWWLTSFGAGFAAHACELSRES
ncbi:MAG: stilbene synthase [Rhizobiaceae bacterium]|nr:stilbene synthase [Rhizobiaceae bacterium]